MHGQRAIDSVVYIGHRRDKHGSSDQTTNSDSSSRDGRTADCIECRDVHHLSVPRPSMLHAPKAETSAATKHPAKKRHSTYVPINVPREIVTVCPPNHMSIYESHLTIKSALTLKGANGRKVTCLPSLLNCARKPMTTASTVVIMRPQAGFDGVRISVPPGSVILDVLMF